MTAIVLPDIDRSTLQELRDRMPSLKLSEIELPSLEDAGREADRTIDRVLGRSRPTLWPWIAAGIALAAVIGTAVALVSWSRRPAWPTYSGTTTGVASSTDELDLVAEAETPFAVEEGQP